MKRRTVMGGGLASGLVTLVDSRGSTAWAAEIEPDPDPVGPGKLDAVVSNAAGRIVITDSFSYCDERIGVNDVIVGGSYAGASTTGDILRTGFKAIIGHDAGIGRARAGISGLPFCDRFGIPMAAVMGTTATLSNGNSVYGGLISSVNEAAERLGVRPGQKASEAAELMLRGKAGKPIHEEVGVDQTLREMEQVSSGRIFARVWLLSLPKTYPDDVFALGTHSARVAAEHAFRWNVKGWIANDAGMGKNNSGIAGLAICGERGMPAAAVSAFSASIGDALSTYNDGIISAVNEPALRKGVLIGMTAKEALRSMTF